MSTPHSIQFMSSASNRPGNYYYTTVQNQSSLCSNHYLGTLIVAKMYFMKITLRNKKQHFNHFSHCNISTAFGCGQRTKTYLAMFCRNTYNWLVLQDKAKISFLMGLSRLLFSLFSSFQYSWQERLNINFNFCRWLDSNHGPLQSEPLPKPTIS